MQAMRELFMTDVGLLSLAVLAGIGAMAVYFARFFSRHIAEDEAAAAARGERH